MKATLKTTLTVCLVGISSFVLAQDVIITKDSKKINAKVTEVNIDNIKYKDFDNQEGPIYTILKNEIVSILYQNGKVETFASSTRTSSANFRTGYSTNRSMDCVKDPILEHVWISENSTINFYDRRAGKRDIMEILQKTYYPSYKEFVSGNKTVNAGIFFLTTGGAVFVVGGILMGTSDHDKDAEIAGIALFLIGGAEIIISMPLIAVGNAKRKRAVREFTRNCLSFQPEKTEKQLDTPHLDLNFKNNSLGLAWTF